MQSERDNTGRLLDEIEEVADITFRLEGSP